MIKQILTTGMICGMIVTAQAQITLTKTLPPIGSKMNMKEITSSISSATTGMAQTWDYSNATFSNVVSYEIVELNTLSQNIRDSFPAATYVQMMLVPGAPDINLNPMFFIEDRPDMLFQLGSQASGGTMDMTSDTLFLFTHSFDSTLSYGNRHWVKYTGYGSMTIDGKTFDPVVMHEYTNKSDGKVQHYFFTLSPYFQLLLAYSIESGTVSSAYYYQPEDASTSVTKDVAFEKIKLYPNPANDFVTIVNMPHGSTLSITDMAGKLVYGSTVAGTQATISTANFVNGIYFIRLEHNGSVVNRGLIVNK